jgi:hypothetical protein
MTHDTSSARVPRGESPAGWVLERHDHGRLVFIAADGVRHDDVDVLRAFPVSAADGPVAIVGGDGGELAWVDALAAVALPLRTILEQELAEREFLPVIERIEAIADSEPAEWTVSTDRGPHRFKVAHADDVVRQPDGAVFITDTDGMRYLVPRFDALDAESRQLLDSVE